MSITTGLTAPATAGNKLRNFGAVALANNQRFGLKTNPGIQSELHRINPSNQNVSKLLQERQGNFQNKSDAIVGDGSNANQYLQQAIQKQQQVQLQQQQQAALAQSAQRSSFTMQANGARLSPVQNTPANGGANFKVGPTSNIRQSIVSTAKQYLGIPYVWGGKTPRGFDCSGLTSYVYRQFGISLPAWSNHQTQFGTRSHISNARPGDLVGWNRGGHVGIYIGNGMLLHSPRPGRAVEIRRLSANEGAYAVRLQLPGD